MSRRQGIFWLLTIPYDVTIPLPLWSVGLIAGVTWIIGQQELGEEGYYHHWQIFVAFSKKTSLAGVRAVFGPYHAELSRSEAAISYVQKEETRIDGTQFEHGSRPFRRNSQTDWEDVWTRAQLGELEAIPANVRVVSYRTLRAIGADFDRPKSIVRTCYVFWGSTGTGKSRRAWEEAGIDAYSKDPRSKFFCGYQGKF